MSSSKKTFWTETLPNPLPANPLEVAAQWLTQAQADASQPNPNAMVLATVDGRRPPFRTGRAVQGDRRSTGYIVFYTNYRSRKGGELPANPRAAVVFHWDHRHRQVRGEGRVEPCLPPRTTPIFARAPGKASSAPGPASKANRWNRGPRWPPR